eukprot:s189_g21.t1
MMPFVVFSHCKQQARLCALALPAPPITWVDDVAVPIVTVEAEELESTVACVASSAITLFKRFGLILNLKHRKTEVVVALRDRGAPQLRHDLFVDRLGRIPLPVHDSV